MNAEFCGINHLLMCSTSRERVIMHELLNWLPSITSSANRLCNKQEGRPSTFYLMMMTQIIRIIWRSAINREKGIQLWSIPTSSVSCSWNHSRRRGRLNALLISKTSTRQPTSKSGEWKEWQVVILSTDSYLTFQAAGSTVSSIQDVLLVQFNWIRKTHMSRKTNSNGEKEMVRQRSRSQIPEPRRRKLKGI